MCTEKWGTVLNYKIISNNLNLYKITKKTIFAVGGGTGVGRYRAGRKISKINLIKNQETF